MGAFLSASKLVVNGKGVNGTMNGVSVVLPVFNGAAYLEEALDSLFRQTRAPDEIVVIDDGSTDQSPGLLKKYESKIKVIQTPNRGLAASRNEGISRANSAWVAFLDQDDRWLPEKLELFLSRAKIHPRADLLFSDAVTLSPDGRRLRRVRCDPGPGDLFQHLFFQNRIISSTVFLRKELWERVGPLRGDFLHPAAMVDWEFFLRASAAAPALYLSSPLTENRVHGESSLRSRLEDAAKDQKKVLASHDRDAGVSEELRERAQAMASFEIGMRFLAAGHPERAREEFAASRRSARLRARAAFYGLATYLPPVLLRWGRRGRELAHRCLRGFSAPALADGGERFFVPNTPV